MKKNLICKIMKCDRVDPEAVAEVEGALLGLIKEGKDVLRVAPYKKTLSMVALTNAIEKAEVARECK